MKKIGFIDYYISEWHANNYPSWIKDVCEKTGYDYAVKFAFSERDDSPFDGRTADKWCKDYGVARCATIEELCEKSDVILILAPSDPDKHLGYAEKALKFGKRTYIDKTFAPSIDEAQKIFAAGKNGNSPFFSTSALRYATELDDLVGCENVIYTGGGGNYEEYIIHQVEPIVKIMTGQAISAVAYDQGGQTVSRVKFNNGGSATMLFAEPLPFTVCAEKNGARFYRSINSDFFKGLMADILRFYETGETSFDIAQTLTVMRIRDALIESRKTGKEVLIR